MNESHEIDLIYRLVEDESTDREWDELEALAQRHPSVWREVALAQRDHARLSKALSHASAVAEQVAIPERVSFSAEAHTHRVSLNRFGTWTGWAVAALVTVVASLQLSVAGRHQEVMPTQPQVAGASLQSAADAFRAYLEKGRETGAVVGEVPTKLVVDAKPAPSGKGFEVIYLRQVMERAIVPDLYQFSGQDEAGRPTLVRYQQPVGHSM